jgi:hypothetical protein
MDNNRHRRARLVLVAGFVLSAVGAVVGYVRLASSGVLGHSPFLSTLLSLIEPLTTVVAVWIWWWLSSISPTNEAQRLAFIKAWYGLAISYLLSVTLWSLIVFPGWTETFRGTVAVFFWLQAVGITISFVGFVLLAREFTVGFEVSEVRPADEAVVDVD